MADGAQNLARQFARVATPGDNPANPPQVLDVALNLELSRVATPRDTPVNPSLRKI